MMQDGRMEGGRERERGGIVGLATMSRPPPHPIPHDYTCLAPLSKTEIFIQI